MKDIFRYWPSIFQILVSSGTGRDLQSFHIHILVLLTQTQSLVKQIHKKKIVIQYLL